MGWSGRVHRARVSALARLAAGAVLAAGAMAGAAGTAASASAAAPTGPPGIHTFQGPNGETDQNVCSDQVAPGQARCFAHIRTDSRARSARPHRPAAAAPSATIGNNGAYDPPYLQSAYNAPSATQGSGRTVAIVDAYDDPNAAADLTSYRSFFNLSACTTSDGCFRKVDEHGGTSYPSANSGWGQEISLDLDMVSALCPNCRIMLVEAASSSLADLGTAVNTAVSLGANVVSNSYGGGEYSGEVNNATTYYDHPGVAITVASGDNGYGPQFPAASPYVTAVGGTSLNQATASGTRSATETAWSGAGSGCSAYEAKPAWQRDSGCARRTIADVSAVADPNTGVWVYDTYSTGGWVVFGGTSVATPIVGAMYALAASPGAGDQLDQYPYETPTALNDVTSGSNGRCGSYLCTAGAGYDGPTGLGTPNATPAFAPGAAPSGPPSGVSVPGAPGNLTARTAPFGSRGVNLSWSAPSSNGGAAVTSYVLYRGTSSGAETSYTTVSCSASSCSYHDASTRSGTTYWYQVAATNTAGTGPRSAQASARAR